MIKIRSLLSLIGLSIGIVFLLLVFLSLEYFKNPPQTQWQPGQMAPNEVEVTFPEGFTAKQIEERLQKEGLPLKDGSLVSLDSEGYLYPDTYRFYTDMDARQVSQIMQKRFQDKVGEIPQEDLILASIVQKEAGSVPQEDKRIIAGIFQKRFENNYPLQSDATVNYITGKNHRQPSIDDTKTDSPYNTYQNVGLPPGPICNPGLAVIKAVRRPKESSYWFFLHPNSTTTIYARTFAQQQRLKRKYLD